MTRSNAALQSVAVKTSFERLRPAKLKQRGHRSGRQPRQHHGSGDGEEDHGTEIRTAGQPLALERDSA